jgi:hypothetical protein
MFGGTDSTVLDFTAADLMSASLPSQPLITLARLQLPFILLSNLHPQRRRTELARLLSELPRLHNNNFNNDFQDSSKQIRSSIPRQARWMPLSITLQGLSNVLTILYLFIGMFSPASTT